MLNNAAILSMFIRVLFRLHIAPNELVICLITGACNENHLKYDLDQTWPHTVGIDIQIHRQWCLFIGLDIEDGEIIWLGRK